MLTESLDTTECMNGGQRPGWFFAHAQDDLNLPILHMFKGSFSLDVVQMWMHRQKVITIAHPEWDQGNQVNNVIALLSTKNTNVFSYFSMKTYIMGN